MKAYQIALVIVAAMSVVAFFAYALDKYRAKRNRWRISEKALLLLSFAGGAIGGYCAMFLFRHRTKKFYFHLVNALSVFLHIAVVAALALYAA